MHFVKFALPHVHGSEQGEVLKWGIAVIYNWLVNSGAKVIVSALANINNYSALRFFTLSTDKERCAHFGNQRWTHWMSSYACAEM